eukprot:CAMPEP_0174868196 /NCGR_PEP_ID=MMETSP1114-20130205/65498_1 /TAXON_ID=312471 /ORGANISM="Neobodo designis, Strain CCAP 1951/1" /LENGTH=53 /DNA_ID=CAMNT_0016103413 /DNA_START=68 /DNA_END=226 /DNA_ORIENTATION=+
MVASVAHTAALVVGSALLDASWASWEAFFYNVLLSLTVSGAEAFAFAWARSNG